VQFVAVRKVRNNDDRSFAIEGSNFQLLRTFGQLLDPHVLMPFVCFICQLVDDLTIRGRNFYELFRKALIDFRGRVDFASCMVRETPPALFAPAAPAPAPAALMLAAAAHAPAAHAPAAPATAAPATAAPAAAAPAEGNATEEMATLGAALRAGAITLAEFLEHAKRLTQP